MCQWQLLAKGYFDVNFAAGDIFALFRVKNQLGLITDGIVSRYCRDLQYWGCAVKKVWLEGLEQGDVEV